MASAVASSPGLPSDVAGHLGMRAGLATAMLDRWAAAGVAEVGKWVQGAQVLRSFFLGHELLFLTHHNDTTTPELVFHDLQRDMYNLPQHKVLAGDLILDVGGHIGVTAILLKILNPAARVVSFEPAPPSHFFFSLNLALNGMAASV